MAKIAQKRKYSFSSLPEPDKKIHKLNQVYCMVKADRKMYSKPSEVTFSLFPNIIRFKFDGIQQRLKLGSKFHMSFYQNEKNRIFHVFIVFVNFLFTVLFGAINSLVWPCKRNNFHFKWDQVYMNESFILSILFFTRLSSFSPLLTYLCFGDKHNFGNINNSSLDKQDEVLTSTT